MSENLLSLKRRIKAAKNIAQVARAMEMVSASKIRKARETLASGRPYAKKITELTIDILEQAEPHEITHPYVVGNDSVNTLVLVISSDKGLCGALNTNLLHKFAEIAKENVFVITLGKKARRFCKGHGCRVIAEYGMGTTIPEYSVVYPIIEVINNEYLSGNVSSFKILFNEFDSMYKQTPTLMHVLPIEAPPQAERLPHEFEPGEEEIVDVLFPYYLEVVLYETIIEAFTSEQAARMIAMNNAKTNAMEMSGYLTLVYNRSRQEKITNELQVLANYSW